jgi:hypothetical protein
MGVNLKRFPEMDTAQPIDYTKWLWRYLIFSVLYGNIVIKLGV